MEFHIAWVTRKHRTPIFIYESLQRSHREPDHSPQSITEPGANRGAHTIRPCPDRVPDALALGVADRLPDAAADRGADPGAVDRAHRGAECDAERLSDRLAESVSD